MKTQEATSLKPKKDIPQTLGMCSENDPGFQSFFFFDGYS